MRAVLGRQLCVRRPFADARPGRFSTVGVRLDRRCANRCTPCSAPSRSLRASRISPICANDAASAGSSATALRKSASAASVLPSLPLRGSRPRVQERTVGRARDRGRVRLERLVDLPCRANWRARARFCSTPRNFRTSTRPPHVAQRGIGGQRGLECHAARRSRGSVRPAPAHGRAAPARRCARVRAHGRSAAARRSHPCCASSTIAERGLGRIERRRDGERVGKLRDEPFRDRQSAEYAQPRDSVSATGLFAKRRRRGRLGEVGILRRGDGRARAPPSARTR